MSWIKIPVVCTIEDLEAQQIERANIVLESMGLPLKELPPPVFETRNARVNIKQIGIYYPSHDPKKTILECTTGNYSVCLTVDELERVIAKAEEGQ